MATYKEKRGTNVVPIVSGQPETGVNGEIVYITGEGLASYNGGTWSKLTVPLPPDWTATTQQAKLAISDAASGNEIGWSVAIDGDTLVVGARQAATSGGTGAAYVFTRSGTTWSQQAKLGISDAASSDEIGYSVAIDGDTLVVGARQNTGSKTGAAYVFTRSGTTWSQQAKLVASDGYSRDLFGWSVSIDGDTIVVGAGFQDEEGANNGGAAYVFTRSGTTWSQQAKIQASDKEANDYFGVSISISSDTVVVGAMGESTGGTAAGAAYVFTRSGTTWSQQAKIQASDKEASDYFGEAISISSDTIIVGANMEDTGGTYAGAAYVFTRSGTSWSQQAKIQASDKQAGDYFGESVYIEGDTAVVGANMEDTGGTDAGAAYVFTRSGTTWTQAKKIVASDAQAGDEFGYSIALSGGTIVVGARYEDAGGSNAGTAYTFIGG